MRKGLKYAAFFLAGVLTMVLVLLLALGGPARLGRALKFASVLRLVDDAYVGQAQEDEVTDAALEAAVTGLGDPWSYYMDAESYRQYQDYAANQYQGIGVTVRSQAQNGGFEILALEQGGPAQLAGLVAGDVIVRAEGEDCGDMTSEDLQAVIRSCFGGEVVLTVRHADGTQEERAVSCQVVYDDPVHEQLLQEHIGYVNIENFHSGAGEEVLKALEELQGQGADSFVFDLRGNPGGQLNELILVLDRLLPEGDLFVQTDKKGNRTVETSDAQCLQAPMAVIVDGDSYSAAEFFAAALQEYHWATVVGQPTTGKSRSQVTYTLWDDSAVHLSTYRYLTPSGVDLYEQGGIVPEVEASLTAEQAQQRAMGALDPLEDPQVLAALQALAA